jgi:hypothetical protein
MSVYSDLVFEMAAKPFDIISNHLSIPADAYEALRREYHILVRAFDHMMTHSKLKNVAHRTAAMAIGAETLRAGKNIWGPFP